MDPDAPTLHDLAEAILALPEEDRQRPATLFDEGRRLHLAVGLSANSYGEPVLSPV